MMVHQGGRQDQILYGFKLEEYANLTYVRWSLDVRLHVPKRARYAGRGRRGDSW